ncbi:MAG: hypothetical protein HOV68_08080 [Streptomycetaceae bacterium]|nr:hypothetical protein [Streptomycetaceae bacterium]
MTSKRIPAVLAAAILGGSLLSGTAVAEAQQPGPTADKPHCAYHVDTKVTRCFATYAEVTESARATDSRTSGPITATMIVATIWADGQGSASWSIQAGGCGYGYGNIPSGMNDKTSSITVYSPCRVNLWTNSNQSGNFEVHYPGFSWVTYNNQASSYEYYPA